MRIVLPSGDENRLPMSVSDFTTVKLTDSVLCCLSIAASGSGATAAIACGRVSVLAITPVTCAAGVVIAGAFEPVERAVGRAVRLGRRRGRLRRSGRQRQLYSHRVLSPAVFQGRKG